MWDSSLAKDPSLLTTFSVHMFNHFTQIRKLKSHSLILPRLFVFQANLRNIQFFRKERRGGNGIRI